MRVRTTAIALLQAALLTACERATSPREAPAPPIESKEHLQARDEADAIAIGAVGGRERPAASPTTSAQEQWFRPAPLQPAERLVVRTGQASIEVDSLESAMGELRNVVRRAGGFVADAAIRSGRDQLRQATLELKVPADRFDDLTEGLQPIGRVEFVNVSAEDVSEEFVDLTARVGNGRRLEERLIDLLRTRTGKLQDVLSVERELARVREEIERLEGRLRYLKASAQLSTLSVALHEPLPIVTTRGSGPIAEAFRAAWRNFVGVLTATIASLGYLLPLAAFGWGLLAGTRKWRKAPAAA